MPQFDFYTWFDLSFWTILSFHSMYFFLLYFVINSLSEVQKTVAKLDVLLVHKTTSIKIIDFVSSIYLNKKFLS
jgi:hypothetical protein